MTSEPGLLGARPAGESRGMGGRACIVEDARHAGPYSTAGTDHHGCPNGSATLSSSVALAPFQVLGSRVWSVASVRGSTGEKENMTETDAFYKSETFDPAEKYKMDHKRRGLALIFNHERFSWRLTLPERRGTSADRDNLKRRFSELGFEVKCFDDLKAEELLLTIHEASSSSHIDADCFLCVFLSHGEGNHIYAQDTKIEIQTVTGLFKGDKCQSLVGKPKIFIIQACRGDQHDVPVVPLDVVDHHHPLDVNITQVDAASVSTLPAGADFLMCYSVAEGYYSHRETVNGSWYIQDLCEMLGRFGSSLEFTELLTLVNRKVSRRRVDFCKDPNAIGKKQVPCFASMLTKKLYFFPKSK